MLMNKLLKGLLGASAVAAMLTALNVQAQAGQATTSQGTSGQGTSGQGASGTSGASGAGAAGAAPAASTVSKADQKIIVDLAQGNMAEIELARLALSKSQNDQVKTFAQQMIDDHTKALAEVQQLAKSKGVTLPTEIDKKHKALVDKLSGMSGDAFDKTYMAQAGVADHKKMHSMLASVQSKAKDPDVKALAARLMPTVDQHLKAAQQMGSAKGGAKGGDKGARPSADTAAGK